MVQKDKVFLRALYNSSTTGLCDSRQRLAADSSYRFSVCDARTREAAGESASSTAESPFSQRIDPLLQSDIASPSLIFRAVMVIP